ncbi:MAG: hypothetical protein PHE50_01875 [Dehalococcoidales bacterium]|nr:hypothetical protein [Dehalococcoidales bacterium]
MSLQSDGRQFETNDGGNSYPVKNGADYRRLPRLGYVKLESGGHCATIEDDEWDVMVDAVYAPQERFSLN